VGNSLLESVFYMAEHIPEKLQDLFKIPAVANLATLMPNGSPQVTPVWVDYDGQYVIINTSKGRQKERNMERNPRVALDIVDPKNQFHWLSIRGHVAEITEQGAVANINQLSRKYTGHDYQGFVPGETRVMCKIIPDHVSGA
jgi:PPOX class probable F420-dependent enzyme